MSDQLQVVHEFEIEHRGTIRASVSSFRGKRYADLRLWIEPTPGADLIPTKKGLSVPITNLDDIAEALAALILATGFDRRRQGAPNEK